MPNSLDDSKKCFPLVDENDTYIKTITGKKELHEADGFHRAIHVMVETFGGKFILQKKAIGTENGGLWSSAVSGHVEFGEKYVVAATREIEEELGWEVDISELVLITKVCPSEETNKEFVEVYSYLASPAEVENICMNEEEIDEILIAPLDDVIADVEKHPERYSPAFIHFFNRFLALEKGIEDE